MKSALRLIVIPASTVVMITADGVWYEVSPIIHHHSLPCSVVEYLLFEGIIKFCMNYINVNGVACGHGCGDSVSIII